MANIITTEFEVKETNLVSGNADTIVISTSLDTVSSETVKNIQDTAYYLETAKSIINGSINGYISLWLEHNDTVTHGLSSGIRTDNATTSLIVNVSGDVRTIKVVDIYVPKGTIDNESTVLYCFGPNHVRLIGHLNGRETEAIVMQTNVAINLKTNLGGDTTRILETETFTESVFTAEIYEQTTVDNTIAFTAEIYDTTVTATFTAEIYESV